MREKVGLPDIDKLVENKVKSCDVCLVSTPECKREPLRMSPLSVAPWKEVSIDFAEIPNKEYFLLITDDYSRYPVVEIVKSTLATTVLPKLDKVFSEFGVPDVVRSDNGPPFNSKEFPVFANDLGFKHRKVTPKWARANGEIEESEDSKESHQDSKVRAEEQQARAEQITEELPRYTSQYNKSCPGNSVVW